jgi:hypothetical protein
LSHTKPMKIIKYIAYARCGLTVGSTRTKMLRIFAG